MVAAYRRLILVLHPDRFPLGSAQRNGEQRTREFQVIHVRPTRFSHALVFKAA